MTARRMPFSDRIWPRCRRGARRWSARRRCVVAARATAGRRAQTSCGKPPAAAARVSCRLGAHAVAGLLAAGAGARRRRSRTRICSSRKWTSARCSRQRRSSPSCTRHAAGRPDPRQGGVASDDALVNKPSANSARRSKPCTDSSRGCSQSRSKVSCCSRPASIRSSGSTSTSTIWRRLAANPFRGSRRPTYQMSRFDDMTMEQQDRFLADTIRELDTEKTSVNTLADAWKTGDAPTVEQIVLEGSEERSGDVPAPARRAEPQLAAEESRRSSRVPAAHSSSSAPRIWSVQTGCCRCCGRKATRSSNSRRHSGIRDPVQSDI